jgi:hypothetical protein
MKIKILIISLLMILLLGMVSAECVDSDTGKNKYESGVVTSNGETFPDKCEKENIIEYFCSIDGVASFSLLPCVNGCDNGACKLANELPKRSAPEGEDSFSYKPYLYAILIIFIIGMYVYWFKIRKKRRFR